MIWEYIPEYVMRYIGSCHFKKLKEKLSKVHMQWVKLKPLACVAELMWSHKGNFEIIGGMSFVGIWMISTVFYFSLAVNTAQFITSLSVSFKNTQVCWKGLLLYVSAASQCRPPSWTGYGMCCYQAFSCDGTRNRELKHYLSLSVETPVSILPLAFRTMCRIWLAFPDFPLPHILMKRWHLLRSISVFLTHICIWKGWKVATPLVSPAGAFSANVLKMSENRRTSYVKSVPSKWWTLWI